MHELNLWKDVSNAYKIQRPIVGLPTCLRGSESHGTHANEIHDCTACDAQYGDNLIGRRYVDWICDELKPAVDRQVCRYAM